MKVKVVVTNWCSAHSVCRCMCAPVCVLNFFGHVQFFETPWTVAYQTPLSMGFSRQGYWSGLPFPSPGDLPDPGIEPRSPASQAESSPSEPPGKLKKTLYSLSITTHSSIPQNPGKHLPTFCLYRFTSSGLGM